MADSGFGRYSPGPIPRNYDPTYFALEFAKLTVALSYEREIETLHVEPERLYDGLLVLADGSDWNPGHGQGLYVYYNSQWHYVLTIPITHVSADSESYTVAAYSATVIYTNVSAGYQSYTLTAYSATVA